MCVVRSYRHTAPRSRTSRPDAVLTNNVKPTAKHPWGSITAEVLAALEALDSGTYQDVAEWGDLPAETTRKALLRMTKEPQPTRRVRILRYVTSTEGQRIYPRPVFGKGPGPNARRPKPKPHSQCTRESGQRAVRLLSTVHMGISQRAARTMRAKMRRAGIQF
jgi:hypothetical protein